MKEIALNGLVDRLVDLLARRLQGIELDGLGEFLAERRRAGVIGHQHDIPGRGEEMVVPAQADLVGIAARGDRRG